MLAQLNDCIGALLHLGPNVITFRALLHLGPTVIIFRTLLHLGLLQDNSKIITTNRRYHRRLCLEAWHITFKS